MMIMKAKWYQRDMENILMSSTWKASAAMEVRKTTGKILFMSGYFPNVREI
jgi:hypothetical protein